MEVSDDAELLNPNPTQIKVEMELIEDADFESIVSNTNSCQSNATDDEAKENQVYPNEEFNSQVTKDHNFLPCLICDEPALQEWPLKIVKKRRKIVESLCKLVFNKTDVNPFSHLFKYLNGAYCPECFERISNVEMTMFEINELQKKLKQLKKCLEKKIKAMWTEKNPYHWEKRCRILQEHVQTQDQESYYCSQTLPKKTTFAPAPALTQMKEITPRSSPAKRLRKKLHIRLRRLPTAIVSKALNSSILLDENTILQFHPSERPTVACYPSDTEPLSPDSVDYEPIDAIEHFSSEENYDNNDKSRDSQTSPSTSHAELIEFLLEAEMQDRRNNYLKGRTRRKASLKFLASTNPMKELDKLIPKLHDFDDPVSDDNADEDFRLNSSEEEDDELTLNEEALNDPENESVSKSELVLERRLERKKRKRAEAKAQAQASLEAPKPGLQCEYPGCQYSKTCKKSMSDHMIKVHTDFNKSNKESPSEEIVNNISDGDKILPNLHCDENIANTEEKNLIPNPPNASVDSSSNNVAELTQNASSKEGEAKDSNSKSKVVGYYPCTHEKCTALLRTLCQITYHIRKDHLGLPLPYNCEKCPKEFETLLELQLHSQPHESDQSTEFQCKNCNKYYKTLQILLKHRKLAHVQQNNHWFLCPTCDQRFISSLKRQDHIEITHNGVDPYSRFICQTCNGGFRSRGVLEEHVLKEHKKTHFCKNCNRGFASKTLYRDHMERYHDEQVQYLCFKCGKSCKTLLSYQRHVQNHSLEKVQCEICKLTVKGQASLRNHLKTHEPTEKLTCKVCGKKLKSEYALNLHHRKHTGEKPFTCELCGKSFTGSAALISHRRYLHEGKTNNFQKSKNDTTTKTTRKRRKKKTESISNSSTICNSNNAPTPEAELMGAIASIENSLNSASDSIDISKGTNLHANNKIHSNNRSSTGPMAHGGSQNSHSTVVNSFTQSSGIPFYQPNESQMARGIPAANLMNHGLLFQHHQANVVGNPSIGLYHQALNLNQSENPFYGANNQWSSSGN